MKKAKKIRKVNPLPAAIYGQGPFRVEERESDGFVGTDDRDFVFGAPLKDSPEALAVRVHEYGHLDIRRKKLFPLGAEVNASATDERNAWYQAIADVYNNERLKTIGLSEIESLPLPKPTRELMASLTPAQLAQAYLRAGALDIKRREEIRNAVSKYVKKYPEIGTAIGLLSDIPSKASRSVPIGAETINELLDEMELMFLVLEEAGDDGDEESTIGFTEISVKTVDREEKIKYTESSKFLTRMKEVGGTFFSPTRNKWGEMSVKELIVGRKSKAAIALRRPRPRMVGAFKFPHRANLLISDGRAFALRRRIRGGSILVDCSGSMNLDANDLSHFLEIAPNAIIAGYSGDCSSSRKAGTLSILAKNGSFGDPKEMEYFGGGNIVDGPALDWLNRQKAPRIWISDGYITGIGDQPAANLTIDITKKMAVGKIKMIRTIAETIKFLGGKVVEGSD